MLKIWSELTSPQMRALPKENAIAAVVVGSCEQHARHLPLATDTILGEGVLKAAAMRSKNTVVLLPSIPYGFSHHHRSFAGTVSLPQSVLASVTKEVFRCAAASGFHRLLMLCSHGGNSAALHCALNELGAQHGIKVVFARYWDFAASYIASWRQSGMGGIGHAGEMETALMMHLRPELVDETQLEGYHPAKGNEWFHPDMFAPNKILMYNNFESYSPDGNVGEPAYATAARGEELADYIAAQLALFLDGFWEGNNYIGDD